MKRTFPVVLLLSAFTVGIAAPALAGDPTPTPVPAPKPTKTTFESHNANAFWYFSEQVSKTVRKDTTWYLGAYDSTDGSFSDLYRTVTICSAGKRGEHCTSTNSYGAIDLSEATFSMDVSGLTFAHLEGTYPLQETDEQGNPMGEPVPTSAVADWTGVDQIQLSHGSSTYCDSTGCTFDKWESGYRAAEATGTINGSLGLGQTDDANLSFYKDTSGAR